MRALDRAPLVLLLLGVAGCSGVIGDKDYTEPGVDGRTPPVPGEEFRCREDVAPPPPLVRRLTREEYVGAIRRLTGVGPTATALELLPADPATQTGFSNLATLLNVQDVHARAYRQVAFETVRALPDPDAFIASHAACRTGADCFEGYVESLGLDAFGSPLEAEERTAFMALLSDAEERGEGFEEAAMDALEVALQSPRFLYHFVPDLGDGDTRPLTALELAQRLAFLVTGEAADPVLRDAAIAGELETDREIAAAVDRLLTLPQAREASHRYVRDWLDLDALEELSRDEEHFPEWTPTLGPAMRAETLAFFDRLTWDEGASLARLFDAQFTIVTPELAAHYGMSEPDADGHVELGDDPTRGGLLTHGGVLALMGGAEASTVTRGLAFSALITCGAKIPEPPATVSTDQPPPSPGRSRRDYSEDRVRNPECTGCHSSFEPPIWGLIRYDATGRYSEVDEAGNFLPENGFVRFVDGTEHEYQTPMELGQVLAEADRVRECMVLNVTSYAIRRAIHRADGCSLQQIRDGFVDSDQTYRDLLVRIALSPVFRTVGTEPAEATEDDR
ncbi:MAG: DUF1592 domain-containing protein [Deltaproteobacteria bacterium]|nr:DUF1592 domain-containing protein [Deltaproteobacteria bacterium]